MRTPFESTVSQPRNAVHIGTCCAVLVGGEMGVDPEIWVQPLIWVNRPDQSCLCVCTRLTSSFPYRSLLTVPGSFTTSEFATEI